MYNISIQMGGSSAIGFETSNRQVYYCLLGDYVGIMEAIKLFKSLDIDKCDKTAESVKEFFDNKRVYEEEDSAWRIIKMRDGNIHAKLWGMEGIFTYSETGPL